jgi:hypothetical protein
MVYSFVYTHHGHKLRLFTLREAQFVAEGIILVYRTNQDASQLRISRVRNIGGGRKVGRKMTKGLVDGN